MTEDLFIPPNDFLTFDDGLWTQYKWGKDLPNEKIFFISSGIICTTQKQSHDFITCHEAHEKARMNNMENYMTLDQISELPLGAHSHYHKRLSEFPTLAQKVAWIKEDTETMMEWWEKYLNTTPQVFCFPYNEDMDGLYRGILKKYYGFTDFYGEGRININEIQA